MVGQEILEYRFESEQYLSGPMPYSAGVLANSLEKVSDSVKLAWMYTQGDSKETSNGHWVFYTGLWGRIGSFYREKGTFVDYFDRSSYETTIWKFSDSTENKDTTLALELHPRGSTGTPQGGYTLLTVGDLKRLLRSVAPEPNFSLPVGILN